MNPVARRLRGGDGGRLLATWACAGLSVWAAAALVPGVSASSPLWWFAVALVTGLVGLVLRPLMVEVSARVGWLAVLPVALVGQAVIMFVAMRLLPGITETFRGALAVSWIAAAVGTLVSWLTTAGTDDGFVTSVSQRRRRAATVPDPDVPGVVFVQIDGVPYPLLRWAVQAGGVPTVRRWLDSGAFVLSEWTPQMPCTTPASQLGILHGTVAGVPAFRWYDRELGRVLVANRPADAAVIEQRTDPAGGLLRDDGVSISNLFTGGAARSMLTMSSTRLGRGSTQTRRAFAWYLTTPAGFARSLTGTVAELVKERYQASRQVRRSVQPRVHRGWTFALLRAVTNGLLRDLNTALVAEELRRGTHSVYVDYVDYDEIAHHAGMFRPESLSALDGLDRVLASLEVLATRGARPYHLVVLSDHGQSQGASFRDRYGTDLSGLCADLMQERVEAVDAPVEGWGRAESIAADVAPTSRLGGRISRHNDEAAPDPAPTQPVVLGSGNLGLLYIPGDTRLSLDDLDARWPRLVPSLVGHPGVGFVAGVDDAGVPWAIGSAGRHNLATGNVEGGDPLAPYGDHAARVLRRAVSMAEAPDLYVNSLVDPESGEVAAFEDLVGSHGGLGGWQDRAVLLVPASLAAGLPEQIEGADGMHRVLAGLLDACGHRRG